MKSTRSLALALLLTSLVRVAIVPAGAQANSHVKFVESIRQAVKNPGQYHELYRLVIRPEFVRTVREAAKAGNDALVVEMLQAYRGQDSEGDRGGTALIWAAYYSDAPLLKILLDRGRDVNAQDADGDTPLHQALGVGRTDIVNALLQKGANVNIANKEGWTPLMLAAADNRSANTRAILDRNADVNAQNRELVANVTMAMRKMFLAPKRSAAQPLIGRKTAAESR